MRTIAISIDQDSLDALDRMAAPAKASGREASQRRANRSEMIRRAVRQFVERHERAASEAADRRAIARHRKALGREAAALVGEQAKR
jgi:metal-responsive CopG/Arc/MetJ family transcriptional regulator